MASQIRNTVKKCYPDYLLARGAFRRVCCHRNNCCSCDGIPQDVGRQIDFSAQYRPKPEWYFLRLYQLVRYFPGRAAFFGTVLIPVASMVFLISTPYLDTGKYGRRVASAMCIALLIIFIIFTLIPAVNP
ncbi:MAG TPA: hypothetical protein DCP92_03370 [Nitrospiraceae bacterium]|nr:hypothetical protein [Nitrospiraceae bacterium]